MGKAGVCARQRGESLRTTVEADGAVSAVVRLERITLLLQNLDTNARA